MTNEAIPDTRENGQPAKELSAKAPGALGKALVYGLTMIVVNLVLRLRLSLPLTPSICASATAGMLLAYWIPPRPRVGFARYAVAIVMTGVALLVIFSVPFLLREYMRVQLAASLPVLVLSFPLRYALRKVIPESPRISLPKWLAATLIIAGVLASEAAFLFGAAGRAW